MLKQYVWIIQLYQLLKGLKYEQISILEDEFLMDWVFTLAVEGWIFGLFCACFFCFVLSTASQTFSLFSTTGKNAKKQNTLYML